MAASRQGSASYTVVIGALTALLVGAMMLTFVVFPVYNAFTASGMWAAETTAGVRVLTYVGGIWQFWPAILLFALVSFIWVRTRQ